VTRRVGLLVWGSTLAMPLLFLAVAQSMRTRVEVADPVLFWVALASAGLFLLLALLLPRRIGGSRAGPEATTLLRLTVGWAFCEAAALLPLVAGFPTEARWARHRPAMPPLGRR
jgi:hypothetical protein